MVVNFSHEETELPKATVLGLAEETSGNTLAAISDSESSNSSRSRKICHGVNTVGNDSTFRQYLKNKLGYLSREERSVLEPVLMKYTHIFHEEGSTDFAEHRIVTGDAKPIRKSPYSVQFSLIEEMGNKVLDVLDKGIIKENTSPAILVPKKSLDGKPKHRFCIDFQL